MATIKSKSKTRFEQVPLKKLTRILPPPQQPEFAPKPSSKAQKTEKREPYSVSSRNHK